MSTIINATTTNGVVIQPDNSGSLVLQTNSGTTALTIDTSQNVGIGTTSPTGKLDITKTTNGNAFVVNALGGATPNFTVQGSGEQTFRLYNSASTGSTRTSIKLASRLNTDWEWIAFTDAVGTGINDLTIANLAGTALSIDASRNLKFNSGYGSVATAYGCRAWVNFNGTGTVAIRASGNVTSITDNSVGDFTVNFTTAMPDVNFCANITATGVVSGQHCIPFIGTPGSNDTSGFPTTSSFRFSQYNASNSGFRGDAVVLCVSIFR